MELVVDFELRFGRIAIGADLRRRGALRQTIGVELGFEAVVVGLGASQLLLGVAHRLLHLRVAQLQDDRIGLDQGTGAQHDALDAALGRRRQLAAGFVDGYQACPGRGLPATWVRA